MDAETQVETPAPAAENTLNFDLQDKIGDVGNSVSIDLTRIPADTRRQLLETKVREIVNGRPHAALMRFNKLTAEYTAKCAADPTGTFEAPATPNLAEIAASAVADLYAGKVQQRNRGGSPKARTAKDPVDAVVTQAVVRELFEKRKRETPGTKYTEIVKEVGESGIAFLNARAVALAAGDTKRQAELEKQIEAKYIKPARAMVGQNAKGEATGNDLL